MSIRVALFHQTRYRYDRLTQLGPQLIRLRPAPHNRTPVLSYSLKIEPAGHFLNWQQDPQANFLARAVFPKPVRELVVTVDLVADMTVINPFDFFVESSAENFPFTYEAWLHQELAPFLRKLDATPRFANWLAQVDRTPRNTVTFLTQLNQQVQQAVKYLIRLEPGVQMPEETLEKGSGSCRDSAWLLVQLLRHLGMAARFVSGYLIQLKPDVKALDGPSGAEVDFTDLHAWCEAFIPGAGWVGLDPTSGLLAGEGHIPLAATPEPSSAAPIAGALSPCEVEFEHVMKVTRVHEDPRVTLPYSESQWADIDALARQIDAQLHADDVRLSMGGEPTFVSIDDMDGAEWNTAAVGPHKRRLAEDLIRRLHQQFAPGGLLHFGQGKWYPGEQLPRWALGCYWRRDGQPVWRNPALIAAQGSDQGQDIAGAERFMQALAQRLGVDGRYAVPAFEDPVHFLIREGQLPINVDPTESKLKDAEERQRLRRVFQHGLDEAVGYVLPLTREWTAGELVWMSGLWLLRSRHVVLIPGDSPLGLRLPLPSLPWVSSAQYPYVHPVDPQIRRAPLPVPVRRQRRSQIQQQVRSDVGANHPADQQPVVGQSASWVVRTAICVEPREGRLHVFMPPLRRLEDYLELLAAIEDTAEELSTPVVIEGEAPPYDPRMNHLKVTPDPGVIEVNIQPAHSWDELVHTTTVLYEEARLSRLGTEKFMLDGRHSGTGGGNHVVLGGATPADSPWLRRPDLLRSMLSYWINHPSLSYLFSGLFVGPTSQAPRIDEARHDSLYELELAFAEVDHQMAHWGQTPPWMVDRIFRHLLTDLTGNTHRAEFCIDKLFSPDSSSGRLGLVEFRGFEMPPHARMSLTQQLLLRALVAWFWRQPYRQRPTRWGTALHDRFLLPHFVWQDFTSVLTDLRAAGYPLEPAWFGVHYEFRFPRHGTIVRDGIELELRQAIEPWLVLGEEPGAGGTTRYVDSSVERLQVRVDQRFGERYLITCNQQVVPLQPTGVAGQFVAAVRYRAWQPSSCLHPTVGVNTPLVFDVYDTQAGRALGGCTYHVAHPAGRNYATFPVNAMEAEARRGARFFDHGHTPAPYQPRRSAAAEEFPLTLDLRWPPR